MAKKVFPLSLGATERRILETISERDGCSMAEAARRIIRSYKLEVVPPPVGSREPSVSSENVY